MFFGMISLSFPLPMKIFQKVVFSLLLILMMAVPVFAQGEGTILPQTTSTAADCKGILDKFTGAPNQGAAIKVDRDNILGCAIKTGRISLSMIPFFISYITNYMLGLVGLICVLFVVLGGYRFVLGGLTADKEKGKKTIEHALIGMGVALMAWTVVTVIINAITS